MLSFGWRIQQDLWHGLWHERSLIEQPVATYSLPRAIQPAAAAHRSRQQVLAHASGTAAQERSGEMAAATINPAVLRPALEMGPARVKLRVKKAVLGISP